jgi:hypothetical protein
MDKDGYHGYNTPVMDKSAALRIATAFGWEPKRTWVGLTDEDRFELAKSQLSWEDLLIAVEAKLWEKNK